MFEQTLIISLAGWRLASLFVHEDGPFQVFSRFRAAIGIPVEGEIRGFLPELFSCIWCLSLWSAAAWWAVWELWRPEPAIIFAAAGGIIAAERWVNGTR